MVFGDSKARITLQLGLLCSTSSGCCCEPLSHPKLDLWHGRISRGNCDMFPSLADFITDAGHTISPPYFNQRLSTCQQWENYLRRTLKRIIALLRGFEIRLCAQQTSYQLICRNSFLSWRVTVDWRNSLAPALFRHSGQHWCRNILNSVTSPWRFSFLSRRHICVRQDSQKWLHSKRNNDK